MPVDVDKLPPTQYLILEVLAARHRLGEDMWPFPTKLRSHADALVALGLVDRQSGNQPYTFRLRLTDAGRAVMLADRYADPVRRATVAAYRRLRANLGGIHFQYRAVGEDRFDTCAGCNQVGELVPWPCRTWQAIEDLDPEKGAERERRG